MKVASFDIGSKNFAFCISSFDEIKLGAMDVPVQRYKANGNPTDKFQHTLNEVYKNGEVLNFMNLDLTKDVPPSRLKSYLDPMIFRNMIKYLDHYKIFFDEVDVVIIEQQMSFGRKLNIKAVKIGQACMTYFMMRHPNIEVIEYPAYHKTKILGAPKKLTKPQRKSWSVEECKQIFQLREDFENLEFLKSSKKRDDLADCNTQLESFKILRFIDNKI